MSSTISNIRQRLLRVTAAHWNLPAQPSAASVQQWLLRFAV